MVVKFEGGGHAERAKDRACSEIELKVELYLAAMLVQLVDAVDHDVVVTDKSQGRELPETLTRVNALDIEVDINRPHGVLIVINNGLLLPQLVLFLHAAATLPILKIYP